MWAGVCITFDLIPSVNNVICYSNGEEVDLSKVVLIEAGSERRVVDVIPIGQLVQCFVSQFRQMAVYYRQVALGSDPDSPAMDG